MKPTRCILLLSEWGDSSFLEGVLRYAKQAHWHLCLEYLYRRELPETWKRDGIIHMVESREAGEFIEKLQLPSPDVIVDSESQGKRAADYFLDLGFRHFAYYAPDYKTDGAIYRYRGYEERLGKHGFSAVKLIRDSDMPDELVDWNTRKDQLISELSQLPKPCAIFCADDRMALRVVEACIDGEIDIPMDIAVLGCGNLKPACESGVIPLSSIRINFEKLGYMRAENLDQMLNGETPEPVLLPAEGVEERRSTQTIAVHNPRVQQAVRYMLDHYKEPVHLRDICAAGRISRRHMTHTLKEELNVTPGELLENIRLKNACRLLLTTDMPIKRVAYESGFGTPLRLQRVFRKRHQTTPSAWRKNHQPPLPPARKPSL
jgi:LacI family transcriptional regulator